jgi:predicted dehydrogenase
MSMHAQRALRVGVVGCGSMGSNHLRVLSEMRLVDIAFVVDSDAAKVSQIANRYGTVGFVDVSDALPEAEAVIVASPTSTHSSVVESLFRRFARILVEKPLTADTHSSLALEQAAKASGVSLQIGFIERYNPAVQGLMRILDGTDELISLEFERISKVPDRLVELDVVRDLMIHDLDLALLMAGPVADVMAMHPRSDNPIEQAHVLLRHVGGAVSQLHASRISQRKHRRIRMTQASRMAEADLISQRVTIHEQGLQVNSDSGDIEVMSTERLLHVIPAEPLRRQLEAFLRPSDLQPPPPQVEDSLSAIDLCERILRVLEESR